LPSGWAEPGTPAPGFVPGLCQGSNCGMYKCQGHAGRNPSFQEKKKHGHNLVYKQKLTIGWGERLDGFVEDSDSLLGFVF